KALEALQLDAFLGHSHHRVSQRLEGGCGLRCIAQADLEGGGSGKLDQLAVHAHERPVLLRVKKRRLDAVRTREARLGLDRAYSDLAVVAAEQLGGMGLAL